MMISGICLVMASSIATGQPHDSTWPPNPRLDWQELKAEHVRVLYTPDLAQQARLAAAAAARAHDLWKNRLGATPPATPTIVLADRSDMPRSRLEVVPHPVIYLDHPVPQSSDGWTSLHGSGLVDQVIAAYGKIVDRTRVGEFAEDLRAVIGAVAVPGLAKPLYLREGLTVMNDPTARTALPEMATRAWHSAEAWPTLAEMSAPHVRSHGLSAMPQAGALGAAWLDAIAQARDAPVRRALSRLYAERPLVPLMADPLFATAGRSSGRYYQVVIEGSPQTATTQRIGQTVSPSGLSLDPAWALDGSALVYRHQHADRRSGLRLATADGATDRPLIDGRVGPPTWSRVQSGPAQTATLVYPKARHRPNGRRVMDLVEYRLSSKDERRLTTDERIDDVVAFPNDPSRLLVTRSEPGLGQSLVVLTLIRNAQGQVEDIVRRIVRTFDLRTRVLDMDVAPDGQTFALSVWRQGQGADLVLLDRWGKRMTPLVTGPAETRDPTFSPEGTWLLYADDRSGVPQIYARNRESGQIAQVTNAAAGAFDPAVSPAGDRLALVGYSTDGYTVRTMPYDPTGWPRVDPERDDGPRDDAPAGLTPVPTADITVSPYRPGTDLIPSYWLPLLGPSNLGVFTHNADPIRGHAYDVSLGLQFAPFDFLYAFNYTNAHIYPELNVELRGTPGGAAESVRFTFPLRIDLGSTRSLSLGWRHAGGDNMFFLQGALTDTGGLGRFERTSHVSVNGGLIGTPQSPSHRLELRWREQIRLPLSGKAGAHHLAFDVQTAWSDADEFRLGGINGPYPLRGASRGVVVGHQLARASLDYRFPVWRLQWACCGATPWPVFLDTLSSSLFVDIGTAGDALDPADAKLSAGVEFQLGVSLGYGIADATLRAGLAYRFDTDSPEIFVQMAPRF